MTEEKMKQLLKEMQQHCTKSITRGVVYEDNKSEEKAMAIGMALDLIEQKEAQIQRLKNNKIKYNIRYKANGELIEKKKMTWEEVQTFIDGLERQKEAELEVKKVEER
jgi:hypothetical protein